MTQNTKEMKEQQSTESIKLDKDEYRYIQIAMNGMGYLIKPLDVHRVVQCINLIKQQGNQADIKDISTIEAQPYPFDDQNTKEKK